MRSLIMYPLAVIWCLNLLLPSAISAPIADCSEQSPCLTFKEEVVFKSFKKYGSKGTCNSYDAHRCEYTVCLTFDPTNKYCTKDDDISYTCIKDPDMCQTDSMSFENATVVDPYPPNSEQCQTAAPGSTLQFTFKDGNGEGCNDSFKRSKRIFCEPMSDTNVTSCANSGKECLWTYKLPKHCPRSPHIFIDNYDW